MQRMLGKSQLPISAMGLGCWAIGGPFWSGENAVGWGQIDDQESIRAVQGALSLGVSFFDTADVYGGGHSEEVLGQALKDYPRDSFVLASKFSNTFDAEKKQITGNDASPAYIRRACDASLERLQTDYIDLYQFHNGGYDKDRAVEVRETLEELVAAGKIRYYGWSTDDPERAAIFAQGPHCTAIQHQLNVFNNAAAMVELCESLQLASINRGPLAMGLLSGKYSAASELPTDDVRGQQAPAWMRFFQDGKPLPEWLGKLDAVRDILQTDGRTLVQGALAWIWGRSDSTIPIPGFKTVQQVEENAKAMEFGPLAKSEMKEIERILSGM